MNKSDNKDKLNEALKICEIHFERMRYATQKVTKYFPLNEGQYHALSDDDLSYLDQIIFRFSKLQDSMGTRLFPSLLENHKQWLILRETRNLVTHEYPFFTPEIIEGLNLLMEQILVLEKIWDRIRFYLKERFV